MGITGLIVSSSKTLLWDGLTADEMDRIGDTMTSLDLPTLSYVLWSLSSLVWLLMEDAFDEDLGLRWTAIALCGLALVLFLASWKQAKQRGEMIKLINEHFAKMDLVD